MPGHTFGALIGGFGGCECGTCLQDGVVPLTIKYGTWDHQYDLEYVPNEKEREMEVDVAMCMNFGFGGHNVVLLFKKCTE